MIAIIDYKAGNLTSVKLALEAIDAPCTITCDRAEILAAERVIFPGVGAAGAAMDTLRGGGLIETIKEVARAGTPFLGICLGTQIILTQSEESGGVAGVGLIEGNVKRFEPVDPFDKVPQMGWNSVRQRKPHPVLTGVPDDAEFYFVHSYYPCPANIDCIVGETEYGGVSFASIMGQDNLVATQFHPEKSGRVGLRLLANFAQWDGRV